MHLSRLGSFALLTAACLALVPAHHASAARNLAANPPLVIDIQSEGESMDPAIDYDTNMATVLGNVYDGLVRAVGSKSATIVPDLATSWTKSADGKTWTFKLRSGVKFHDGSTVNAAAVKFTFDRLFKLNQGAVGDFLEISSVDAPDPSTVVFHLQFPASYFLNSLTTLWGTGIISPKTAMAHQVKGDRGAKWLYDHDAGSGPWMVKQWVHGQKIILDPFPGYWKGWSGNHIGEVVIQWPAASSTQREQIEHGDADVAFNMTPQDFDAVAKESGLTVENYVGQTIHDVRFNTRHGQGPLGNQLVRQALSYAWDYDTIVKAVYRGYASRMLGVGPTGLPNFIPAAHLYTYDPAKATALLKQAGYAKGFTLNVDWQTGDNASALMAQIFKADLAPLGITANLQALSNSVYQPDSEKVTTNPDIWIGQWSMDYADDQQMYINYFWAKSPPSSGNVFYFKNPALESVLTQAMRATDPATAKALYTKVLNIVYNEAYEIWAVQPDERIAMRNNVHGYVYNFLYTEFYYDLYALSKS